MSEASVRAIATELGVAKNTAHRAIATLARAGLVESVQRRGDAGRFEPGRIVQFVDRGASPPLLPIFRSRKQAELLALLLGAPELELSLTDLAERLGTVPVGSS